MILISWLMFICWNWTLVQFYRETRGIGILENFEQWFANFGNSFD